PLLVLLITGVSLAQERTVAGDAKPTQSKAKIDPKVQQQLMNNANEIDQHLQELKSCLNHERAGSGSSGPMTAERQASDDQIQALQRSIAELRSQLENGPHYLDQTNKLRP